MNDIVTVMYVGGQPRDTYERKFASLAEATALAPGWVTMVVQRVDINLFIFVKQPNGEWVRP